MRGTERSVAALVMMEEEEINIRTTLSRLIVDTVDLRIIQLRR